MSSPCRSFVLSVALGLLAAVISGPTARAGADPPARALRVCADPNNLPFSNRRLEGFENRIAETLARELGARVTYTWWAQRRGFIRHTLGAGACDVVMGLPRGYDRALLTRPYYRSTYTMVTRRDTAPIRSLDDPALRRLRVGVQMIGDDYANTPPAHALARRGIVDNIVGFMVYGDYAQENPPARIVEAVADGRIDVAVVWGPLAGYFAPRQRVPLDVVPLAEAVDSGVPLAFDIGAGVRPDDRALHDELERALERRRDHIARILVTYGVPSLPMAPRVRAR
jgi:quinoprotein dehydrogenase-associated probable ABC transporter substrate-binding protein